MPPNTSNVLLVCVGSPVELGETSFISRVAGPLPCPTNRVNTYHIERIGEVDVVRITQPKLGYPDLAELQTELDRRIDEGSRRMLVNLAPVAFVDSFGVGVIAAASRRMEQSGGALKLCGVGERVRLSLTITRLDQRLDIHEDEASALDAFDG